MPLISYQPAIGGFLFTFSQPTGWLNTNLLAGGKENVPFSPNNREAQQKCSYFTLWEGKCSFSQQLGGSTQIFLFPCIGGNVPFSPQQGGSTQMFLFPAMGGNENVPFPNNRVVHHKCSYFPLWGEMKMFLFLPTTGWINKNVFISLYGGKKKMFLFPKHIYGDCKSSG